MDIKRYIRSVKDFPKKGIDYKDITPVLLNPCAFRYVIGEFCKIVKKSRANAVAAVESRGFVFGAAVADRLGLPFIMLRKFGKLPYKCHTVSFDLEYGSAKMQIHVDSLKNSKSVVIIDDVLATGGTFIAACKLIKKARAVPVAGCLLLELGFLEGRKNISKVFPDVKIYSLAGL